MKTLDMNVKVGWKLKLVFCFVEITGALTHIDEIWYSKRLWTYLQVLFESLSCLTKLLSIAMVRNFEVGLLQTRKHCVEFCNFVLSYVSVNYLTY
jgi:hypothetical protein